MQSLPDRFELRQVVLGSSLGDRIVIRQGLKAGEQVASRGNFLIDSQLQLAGNPSLIDFELQAAGSFQNQIEANQRLLRSTPVVLLINRLLLYLHFHNLPISIVVFSGIPVAFAGGMIVVAVMGVELNSAALKARQTPQ